MMRVKLAIGLLLGALFAQSVASMWVKSAAFDEAAHLASGYSYLVTADFRLNPQHPPLLKLLAGLPLLALHPSIDLAHPAWNAADEWHFGYEFLYGNDADRLLFWGRMPVVLLGLLAALYVFCWARELYGTNGGLLALFLCAFSPNLIANSRLVTLDAALACFLVVTLFHARRFVRTLATRELVLAGIGLGLALASKFSAVILPFVLVLLFGAWVARPGAGDRVPPTFGRRTRLAVVALVGVLAIAAIVVQASYFFSGDLLRYWHGLQQVNRDHVPDHAYYLLGSFRAGGFWYYFPLAFLFKTPVPTLVALVAAAVLTVRRRPVSWLEDAFLALPIVLFGLGTCLFADNMGVRYLLPVYPLLFVFAGRLAAAVPRSAVTRTIAVALGLWYVGGAVAIHPDQLSYFNELAGGPGRGHRVLDDSNIDWGQDLKRLKGYMDANGIERIKLRYGPHVAPEHYGIRWEPITDEEWAGDPPPGVYAFGTHLLIRGERYAEQRGVRTDWLSRYEPVARIGYSLYVFRFD